MSGLPEFGDITRLVGEMVGIPEPDIDANFLEIGGDSLVALQVAIVLEERWGAEVDVQEITFAGTLREIHELVVASVPGAAARKS
jgi:acyl carrier protein